jgi:acetyltransferase
MKMPQTFNETYTSQYESWLELNNGESVFIRPILQADKHLIVDLFNKLHNNTKYMRFLMPLNTLPEDLLFRSTHIDYHNNFALVAVIQEDGKDSIIGSCRYGYNPKDNFTDFAIVVRDDWQHNGLGKSLLVKIFAIGKEHGISRFISIIDSQNNIIKQILRKSGYTVKYSYTKGSTQVEILL